MGIPVAGQREQASPVVTGSFGATGQSASAAFQGSFNVSLWGTFVATVELQRSFDGGTTWLAASLDGSGTAASWTSAISVVATEPEAGVLYRLSCTWTSGTVNYRLSGGPNYLK